jgi:2-dehydropantoate 2-reductase
VTLKAPHLEAALGPLVERGLAETFVSLGNGLVQDRIAGLVGEEKLVIGTVEWGATNLGPGHLAQTTRAPFVVGEPDGRTRDRTRLLAEALGTVADVRITENIRGQVWSKLLVNSAFSGLGAISGLLYREVVADPAGREAALAVWREGYDVGLAQGHRARRGPRRPRGGASRARPRGQEPGRRGARGGDGLRRGDEGLDAPGPRTGAKTEVDVINGGVVEKGREHGVPTPLNEHVAELMHAMERGERQPDRDVFDQLQKISG